MRKKFWNSEKLLSLAAVLVSICTLIVFSYQVRLIRKQQYMSVYPHLQLSNGGSGTLQYKYTLTNNGIGPAFIEAIQVMTKDKTVYEDVIDYVADYLTPEDSVYFYHTNLSPGRLIPSKEEIALIELVSNERLESLGMPSNTHEGSAKLYQVINDTNVRVEIQYKSIYGESWTITNDSNVPIKN